LYVVLENRPGAIGEMCRILKKRDISIFAIGVFIDAARLYVSDPTRALEGLLEYGYEVEERSVLYLYGALEEKQKKGTIILEVDKPDLALKIFRNHQF